MTLVKQPPLVAIAVCFYCIWQSENLLHAWKGSPYDRFGWVFFLIWCAPIALFWLRQSIIRHPSPARPVFLSLGLFFSFYGLAGSLHVLQHIGLAMAVAGLMPSVKMDFPWLLSSLSWMPALGWLSGRFFPNHILIARFILATLPAGWMAYNIWLMQRAEA